MNNKRGISLIVLVITIVVVIILAAAVILSLSGNNPINNARVANLDQTKDGIESSILAYSGKAQSQTLGYYTVAELLTGNREETGEYSIIGDKKTTNNNDEEIYNIDKTKFESKIDTLPSTPTSNGEWYVDGNGKVYLVYDKKDSMPKWMLNKDGNIDDTFLNKLVVIKDEISKGSAKEVLDNASKYYGTTITNYSANGVSDWKIFHSDGKNIYLISSGYLPIDKIPSTNSGNAFSSGALSRCASLSPAVSDSNYSAGSNSILSNNPARKWLKAYLDNYTSANNNMKAVAYMLDTNVWNVYKTDKAEYAIGGPTFQMFIDSYNKFYNTNYRYSSKKDEGINVNGYQINDGSNYWYDWYENMVNTDNKLYVLSASEGAYAMWLSSPSAAGADLVLYLDYNGLFSRLSYSDNRIGFRPIVCLNSDVEVEKNDDGSVTLK